jgi:RNA polymerase sigma factor (sigma-70 family)
MASWSSFAELMDSVDRGEPEAVRRFQQYFRRMAGLARKRLYQRARQQVGAEAIAQSTLLSVIANHAQEVDLDAEDSLWNVLLRLTVKHCRKWNRRLTAQKRTGVEVPLAPSDDQADEGLEPAADQPPPELLVELQDELDSLLATLNEQQREIVALRGQGLSVAQIAERVNLSQTMVYRILQKVRELGRRREQELGD